MLIAFRKKKDAAVVKIMKKNRWFLGLALALLLAGCSDGFYKGMYRGLQQREETVRPTEPFPPEQPSYETYRREREEVLRGDE
jgi:hypothetical protein